MTHRLLVSRRDRAAPRSDLPNLGLFLTNTMCLFDCLFVCKSCAVFLLAILPWAGKPAPGDRRRDVESRKYYRCYCGVRELILLPFPLLPPRVIS